MCIVLSFVVVLVPLVWLVVTVVGRGHSVFSWAFLTKEVPVPNQPGPGMGPAVYGTLLVTGAASAMAVPLGVLGGVYLNEYGADGVIARVLRFFAEIMTGVPSVVMGLFVYTAIVLHTQKADAFAGAIALGCLMLPIVIRTTDEMLRLVPGELREGSVALGSRQARTIVRVVLPAAAPGIVSGALLAIARAAGETAPLLFVIGIVVQDEPLAVQRPEHHALGPDLPRRQLALRRVDRPRVGRRAHAGRPRLRVHGDRPCWSPQSSPAGSTAT